MADLTSLVPERFWTSSKAEANREALKKLWVLEGLLDGVGGFGVGGCAVVVVVLGHGDSGVA